MINKQDFETYLELMMDYYKAKRAEILVSAYKVLPEGDIYDFFEDSKIISVLDSGIIVLRAPYEEEDEEELDEDEKQDVQKDLLEPVFVPWSSIDEIVIARVVKNKMES